MAGKSTRLLWISPSRASCRAARSAGQQVKRTAGKRGIADPPAQQHSQQMGALGGILIADYWVIRKQQLSLPDLFNNSLAALATTG